MPDIKFPSIPSPNANDVKSLAASIGAMKEILEILLGQRGDLKNKAITASTLPAAVSAVPGLIPTDGTNGTNGVNGRDGVDGEDGWAIPGARGPAGADGLRGVPGRDGDDADGIQWLFPSSATPFVPGYFYNVQVVTSLSIGVDDKVWPLRIKVAANQNMIYNSASSGARPDLSYTNDAVNTYVEGSINASPLRINNQSGGITEFGGLVALKGAIPTLQFTGVAGATKIGETYQQGDTHVLSAAAGVTNLVLVDLNTGRTTAPEFAPNSSPVVASAMYGAGTAVNVANGGNVQLISVLGLIVVRDASTSGSGAVYLVSGYGCILIAADPAGVWVASTTTPAAGKASVAMSAGHSFIYNNTGATLTVSSLMFSLA